MKLFFIFSLHVHIRKSSYCYSGAVSKYVLLYVSWYVTISSSNIITLFYIFKYMKLFIKYVNMISHHNINIVQLYLHAYV